MGSVPKKRRLRKNDPGRRHTTNDARRATKRYKVQKHVVRIAAKLNIPYKIGDEYYHAGDLLVNWDTLRKSTRKSVVNRTCPKCNRKSMMPRNRTGFVHIPNDDGEGTTQAAAGGYICTFCKNTQLAELD